MIYLVKEDLIEVIQERQLDDSLDLNEDILKGLEEKTIAFAESYISGRYKANEIFTPPVKRQALLTFVLARLVVYWAVRRNAARKVPDDYTDIFNEARKVLENIQSGAQKMPGLPETSEDRNSAKSMYGNSTNDNFFL